MKNVKLFDLFDDGIRDALIEKDLEDQFADWEEIKNDMALSWEVLSEEDEADYGEYHAVVDKVLRDAGCKPGENVFIWICW